MMTLCFPHGLQWAVACAPLFAVGLHAFVATLSLMAPEPCCVFPPRLLRFPRKTSGEQRESFDRFATCVNLKIETQLVLLSWLLWGRADSSSRHCCVCCLVVALLSVHCGTFLALFGLAQMISDESVQRVADLLHLDKIIDKEALINEKSAFWGRLLFAYAACKPLTPVQVAVAFWCTPHLARFMGRRGIPVHVSKATVTHLRGKLRFRRRKSCEKNTL
ncbi:hypothetical protein TGCAST_277690 [Toxoplasma gondii CAST]|uniref:DUF1279 domain-containing protein n=1 Tax=Toxoplasma gondii CAST TaxID=943122 RepID=A0A3R7Z606_TOXGO|nr:hypothetical protein TGCAST_277690 [Toxoplasma gondii CAST]